MEKRFIIAVLLLSLALRLYGIGANLPNTYWHDENNFVETALRFGTDNLKPPHQLQHGMLLPIILFFEYGAYYLTKKFTATASYTPADFLDEYVANPSSFYLIGRITVMLFGIGCILLVYLISLRLYNRRAANISSLLFSLCLVPFIQSKWTKAGTVSVFFLLAAFLMAARLFTDSRHDKKYYILSGFFVGLATAAKLYAVFGFSFIFLAHLFSYAPDNTHKKIMGPLIYSVNGKMIMSGVFLILGFILFNPFVLVDPKFFLSGLSDMHIGLFDTSISIPWFLYFKSHLKNVVGSRPLEILILISCVYFIFRPSKKGFMLLVYPVTLYLLYMRYPGFAHYLIPAVPFLVIIAGAFLDKTVCKIPYPKTALFAVCAIIFIIVLPCFLNILRYNALISKPDTRTTAKEWIEKNIPGNSSILSEGYILTMPVQVPQLKPNLATLKRDLALVKKKGGRGVLVRAEIKNAEKDKKSKKYNIYKEKIIDVPSVKKEKADYVILSGYVDKNVGEREYLRDVKFYNDRKALYARLEKEYRLVKVFFPYPELGFCFPVFFIDDFRRLESVNLLRDVPRLLQGPQIKIYRKKYQ